MSNTELDSIRQNIDSIDKQLLELIGERASLAGDVARIKQNESIETVFYRPEREAQVLRKIKQDNPGPLSDEEMARLFREIMSACLAHEQPLSIAYLGPEGTFTQAAALKHFGHSVSTIPLISIDGVFREVESGGCHFGVVPVENSTEGVISHTLDTFMQSPLKICGEVELRIHHHLLATGELSLITRVCAHQQALAQCRQWLDSHMPEIERVAVSSNAEAARLSAEDSSIAAIASEAAADCYQLQVIEQNIEDEPENTTRFLIIGKQDTPPSGDDKTTLLFATQNKAGALNNALDAFAVKSISMSKIESRPSRRGMWEYVFFVDLFGHIQEENLAAAIKTLDSRTAMVKILGSYPRAVL